MERPHYIDLISRYFSSHPVVVLLGPRQCGKTTLARMYLKKESVFSRENYFDLENPIDCRRLAEPMMALEPLKGLIIIDEIQKIKELFPLLRVLVDQETSDKKFLILGSASRELIEQSSESLAGRVAYIEVTPFDRREVSDEEKLWQRGGFPKSYLANSEDESSDWREFYIKTFLEQDIPNLGIKIPPAGLRRFWVMLAHYHGNIFNASELGRSFGASDATMRKYLDILTGTFMIRQLQPWHENLSKRQVKAPKIYFRDSGIFHSLLGIHTLSELRMNPKLGASWEGFALEEIIRCFEAKQGECYFWSTYGGAELDLLINKKNKKIGFEFKYCDAPGITKSMQIALEDLKLDELFVIYPGEVDYSLSKQIHVKPLKKFYISG
jgi:predicted AAA+ superfamily ATPase